MDQPFPFAVLPARQHTLAKPASCEGVGLHSGALVWLDIHPAPVNTGLVFYRSDQDRNDPGIRLVPGVVSETRRGTSIQNETGQGIATVEHLLAALYGCAVDNAHIFVRGPEVPALDGSAKGFADLIVQTGLERQEAKRNYLKVTKALEVGDGQSRVSLAPADDFQISAQIHYPGTLIGEQGYTINLTAIDFIKHIAPARTFALTSEIEGLREAGLAKGGSSENCIVVDGMKLINQSGLRFKDEFARHKVLDMIGDIALLGAPVLGRFSSFCAGHKLNNALIHALLSDDQAWQWQHIS